MEGLTKTSLLLLLAFVETSESKAHNSPSILVNGVKAVGSFSVIEHADIKIECLSNVNTGSSGQLSLMVDEEQLTTTNTTSSNETGVLYVSALKKDALRANANLLCSSIGKSNQRLTTTLRLNVMYPPNCSLTEINGKKNDRYLNCDCEANPPVKFFWFAANDKVIYNSTGHRISLDRIYPGATNITCSANNDIHGEEPPAVLIIPSHQKSRRCIQAIVAVVLSVFYSIVLIIIGVRYRKQRKQRYVKSNTGEL